jgi:hypothetical protein
VICNVMKIDIINAFGAKDSKESEFYKQAFDVYVRILKETRKND